MCMAWTDHSTGQSFKETGNDKAAYARASARIQEQINNGHSVDRAAIDIMQKARYIGVAPAQYR